MKKDRFAATAKACDVFLDSIGWSGCNSTMESLAQDLPVVTLPGPLMRGRHSAAILKMIGLTGTIANSVDSYITLAARVGQDPVWRGALRQQIAANKHKLYRDRRCIDDLEAFLERVGRISLETMAASGSTHAA
jgi:predicted O-linked N-acetylglucosamine transferase (SPINDLY family)